VSAARLPMRQTSSSLELGRGMTEELSVGDRAINLTQALKRAGWAENGGQGKAMIAEGRIRVNGEIELRKRRQLAVGDTIESDTGATLLLV
jgi:ribosome-associated protein